MTNNENLDFDKSGSVPFHLFGNKGGALAIGKNYARNAQIGKKSRRKIL